MKLRPLFVLCAFGLFLGGCKTSTTPGDTTTVQQLFPLAVGNWWIYHTLEYKTDGTPSADYLDTLDVLRTEPFQTVQGQTVQGFLATFTHSIDSGFLYFSGSDMFAQQYPPIPQNPDMFLHFPMTAGQIIIIRDTTYPWGDREQEQFIFHGTESVAVTAGSFSCYHFTQRSIRTPSGNSPDSSVNEYYFSSGIGLIKNVQTYTSQGQKVTSPIITLTGYGKK